VILTLNFAFDSRFCWGKAGEKLVRLVGHRFWEILRSDALKKTWGKLRGAGPLEKNGSPGTGRGISDS
jgi:hypothetical protein